MDIFNPIISKDNLILITGANGFIGSRVVNTLLHNGYINLRCFDRSFTNKNKILEIVENFPFSKVDFFKGDLLNKTDCHKAVSNASLIIHLAAGFGKIYKNIYENTILATRHLLDATVKDKSLKRFLIVSSFTVYKTSNLKKGEILDENCEVYTQPEVKGEAYCSGKVKQEEMVLNYHRNYNVPYVFIRPGHVFGPGKGDISGRVGIHKLKVFFTFGGPNSIPLTYVNNCADAIVLAGLTEGIDGQAFNIVDDNLPTGSEFLKLYKKNVKPLKSIFVPKFVSYLLCLLWENSFKLSRGKLPLTYNRSRWSDDWKGNRYSNEKAKQYLGWEPSVSIEDAYRAYFEFCKKQT